MRIFGRGTVRLETDECSGNENMTESRLKKYKSLLCMMVFAIVSLHSFMLHGHRDACAPESHLHDIAHCEQLDVFVPSDAVPDLQPLLCLVPDCPLRIPSPDPACLTGRISDVSDPFVLSDAPDIGGKGLRAPPAV